MYDAADSILSQKLAQIEGVGQVFVGGGAQPAVRAELNPDPAEQAGVGLERCRTALDRSQCQQPERRACDADERMDDGCQRPDLSWPISTAA